MDDLPESKKHLVFVYGTLKRGQPNDYVMKAIAETSLVTAATTVEQYPLVIAGEFNLPMLLNFKSTGKNVQGELHEVDDQGLARLDEFEGHPTFYERLEIDVKTHDSSSKSVRCWTYFIKDIEEPDLSLPHLESYDTHGPLGLPYDTRENDELDTS